MGQDVQAAASYRKAVTLETSETENYCRQLMTLYNVMGQSVLEQVKKRFTAAADLMPQHPFAEN
jgi:hypothetical protein